MFSIYLVRPPDEGPRVKGRKITIQDVTSPKFVLPPFNGSWISGKYITWTLEPSIPYLL